jgi:hypothetical protein
MQKDRGLEDAMAEAAMAEFATRSVRMAAMLEVSVQAPPEDVERIMAAVTALDPLVMGAYDNNAFQSAGGIERYRPREGAAAGAESAVRQRPGVVQVGFHLPKDQGLLERVIEAIFQVHSYQEPLITVQDVLVSRSKGLDDKDNPHRWWNTTGDWKKAKA